MNSKLFSRDSFYFLVSPFHLVEASPWPLTGSVGALFLTVGTVGWFHGWGMKLMLLGLFVILITMIQWWRDVVREGSMQGYHTTKTSRGLRMGVVLFIVSEVCFFFAFFWAFFHSSLAPTVELGNTWPPMGINPLSPWGVPLLNTLVLLSSGVSVTWAHHAILAGNMKEGTLGLLFTVALGMYFTVLQGMEYYESSFSISDSVYGTTFFVATGFHGLHVLIGSTFLTVCLVRHMFLHFTEGHHFGFEAAAWYWHFVDVVWLFLYVTIYWWGSYMFSTWWIFTSGNLCHKEEQMSSSNTIIMNNNNEDNQNNKKSCLKKLWDKYKTPIKNFMTQLMSRLLKSTVCSSMCEILTHSLGTGTGLSIAWMLMECSDWMETETSPSATNTATTSTTTVPQITVTDTEEVTKHWTEEPSPTSETRGVKRSFSDSSNADAPTNKSLKTNSTTMEGGPSTSGATNTTPTESDCSMDTDEN